MLEEVVKAFRQIVRGFEQTIRAFGQNVNALGSRECFFFLIDTDGAQRSLVNDARCAEEKKMTYQTVRTVCFILGILRTDP